MLPGVRKTLDEDLTFSYKALEDQFEKMILQPLLESKQARSQALVRVVVIDTLDALSRTKTLERSFNCLLGQKTFVLCRLRIVVTSQQSSTSALASRRYRAAHTET
jgi:hypothetical protein